MRPSPSGELSYCRQRQACQGADADDQGSAGHGSQSAEFDDAIGGSMGFWEWFSGTTPAGVISETGQKVVAGVFDGVGAMIDRFHLSETDKQEMKMELAKMQLEAYKTQISDVQSARQMQMATRSMWPGTL